MYVGNRNEICCGWCGMDFWVWGCRGVFEFYWIGFGIRFDFVRVVVSILF